MSDTNQSDSTQKEADALAKAQAIYEELLTKKQSAILATTNDDGSPHASYTPFAVNADKTFYVFISTLAHHTRNLMQTAQASLMLIADENETSQIFARERLTYTCQVDEIERDSDDWQDAATLYEARFGEFFKLIKGFKDFKMFKLTPREGLLVVGFGQAYILGGDALDQLSLSRGQTDDANA